MINDKGEVTMGMKMAVLAVMAVIIFLIAASMGGEPEYNSQRDPYDGSSRMIYP